MEDRDNSIRPSQYAILIAGFLIGSLLILSFFSHLAKQDSWIIVLLSFVIILPFLASYVYVSKRFPGKNLIEIHDIVYGRVLGKIISILYVFYFISLFSFNIRDMSVFYTAAIMPETPPVIFLIVITLLCAYAVKKGIKMIARVSFIIIVVVVIGLITTFFLLLGDMDFKNMLPIMELPAAKFIQATFIMSFVPFGEFVLFLMVMPYVNDNKKLGKYSLGGLGIAALFYLVVILRNFAVLGPSGTYFALPSYQSVQMIHLGDFLNRVELLIGLDQTAALFIKISILYFATVKSLKYLLKLKSHIPVILPTGAIAIAYALVAHASETDHVEWGAEYAVFFELPFVAVIPLITLLITMIRFRLKAKSIQG